MNASISSATSAGFAIALASLALAGPLATPAVAETVEDLSTRSRHVDLSDLDLAQSAVINTAHWRVIQAVRDVCGDRTGRMPLEERAGIQACKKQAMTHAERDLARLATRARHYANDDKGHVEIRLLLPATRD